MVKTDINSAVTTDISCIRDELKGELDSIVLFGSYLDNPKSANDIDVLLSVLPNCENSVAERLSKVNLLIDKVGIGAYESGTSGERIIKAQTDVCSYKSGSTQNRVDICSYPIESKLALKSAGMPPYHFVIFPVNETSKFLREVRRRGGRYQFVS